MKRQFIGRVTTVLWIIASRRCRGGPCVLPLSEYRKTPLFTTKIHNSHGKSLVLLVLPLSGGHKALPYNRIHNLVVTSPINHNLKNYILYLPALSR